MLSQCVAVTVQWYGAFAHWKLCYRATRDGFAAVDFHKHADNVGETFVLIETAPSSAGALSVRGPIAAIS